MRPWVSVNFAITWDGRISTKNRTPSDFSSKRDKSRLLEIRAEADAVLASAATVATDNMTMGLPPEELREARVARGQAPYPLRVLLSNSGQIDPGLQVFQKDFSPLHVFSTERMPSSVRSGLRGKAILHLHDSPTVDLRRMMETLWSDCGVRSIDCEGGGRVFRSLLEADLVDQIHLTLCPRIFGGAEARTLTGPAEDFLPASVHCVLRSMEVIDEECFLCYEVVR